MGRNNSEMKRIEDKWSRKVEFSKRRAELNKRARQLSTLCDCEAAVIVFSSEGKLYEYCSGSMNSVDMISSYQKRCREAEEGSSQGVASKVMGINNQGTRFRSCSQLQESVKSMEVMLSRYHRTQAGERTSQGVASKDTGDKNQGTRFRTCKELLELVERVDEHPSAFSPTDIKELSEELTDALKETRSRQMDLQMEKLSNMHIQDTKLTQENEELKQQVASARKQKGVVVDDGSEDPDPFATNQCYQSNPPKELERRLMEENEQLKQQVASAAGKQKDVIDDS